MCINFPDARKQQNSFNNRRLCIINILKQNLEILCFINYIQYIERALTEQDFHSLK